MQKKTVPPSADDILGMLKKEEMPPSRIHTRCSACVAEEIARKPWNILRKTVQNAFWKQVLPQQEPVGDGSQESYIARLKHFENDGTGLKFTLPNPLVFARLLCTILRTLSAEAGNIAVSAGPSVITGIVVALVMLFIPQVEVKWK